MPDCITSLPGWACDVGTAASFCSMALWFVVLLPQLIRNQQRRSVEGLNLLWALINFTASWSNCFFVFSLSPPLPIANRIMAVYMPVMEGMMLVQFFLWWKPPAEMDRTRMAAMKPVLTATAVVVWVSIAVVALVVRDGVVGLAWAAIAMWSIETFPQLWTNLRYPTAAVRGQSLLSVVVACTGKTTDSLNAFLLAMPLQYRVLAWYSSASAWINALHVMVLFVRSPALNHVDNSNLVDYHDESHGVESANVQRSDRGDSPAPVHGLSALEVVQRVKACIAWAPPALENGLRRCLQTRRMVRVVCGLVLGGLILADGIALALTVRAWIAALLPISTAAVVGAFHVAIRCSRSAVVSEVA